jgi:CBS domain-containing protein
MKLPLEVQPMTVVNQILKTKGTAIWSVTRDTSVYDALELMANKNIGAVLVMEGETVFGIFSERDYARKVILKGKSSRGTLVSDIMTADLVYVNADQSVAECMSLMTDNRIRHLPVLSSEGKLAGIITIGDVVKAIISEQELMINHLEGYITGKA